MSHRYGYDRIDVTSWRLMDTGPAGFLRRERLMGLQGPRQVSLGACHLHC